IDSDGEGLKLPIHCPRERLQSDDSIAETLDLYQSFAQIELAPPLDKHNPKIEASALKQARRVNGHVISFQPTLVALVPVMTSWRKKEWLLKADRQIR